MLKAWRVSHDGRLPFAKTAERHFIAASNFRTDPPSISSVVRSDKWITAIAAAYVTRLRLGRARRTARTRSGGFMLMTLCERGRLLLARGNRGECFVGRLVD